MKLWYSEWRARRRRKKGWAITQTRAPEQKASGDGGDERLWENWMANAIIRPSLSSLVPSFLFPAALLFGSTWQINTPTLSVSLSAVESPQLYLQSSQAIDTVVPDSVGKIQLIELSVCSDVTKHHLITAHLICWSAGYRSNLKVTKVIRWITGNTRA